MSEWVDTDRVHWREDDEFQDFSNKVYKAEWTFEQALAVAKIDKYIFSANRDEILRSMKDEWTHYIRKWKRDSKCNKVKGFAALVFLFITIPFDKLDDIGKYFNEVEIDFINKCYHYNTGRNLEIENISNPIEEGPVMPAAYIEWLDKEYDKASWWISYIVYERNNNLTSVFEAPPAKLLHA